MTLHTASKGNMASNGDKPVENGSSPSNPQMSPSSPVSLTPASPITGTTSPSSPSAPTAVRKQLPSIPDSKVQKSLASKMTEKKTSPRGNHSYGPYFIEYSLMAEYNQLQKQNLPGIYVVPSAQSPFCWFGVLFIRQGPYEEGVFKFTIHIPDNYPDGDIPRLVFEHPIFHPLIDPSSGELDVCRAFQKWRKYNNHIWHVLVYARRVFYKIDTKTPLNPEAAVLYEEEPDLYKAKVSESIQYCKEHLYDTPQSDDPHAIRFSEYDSNLHDDVKQEMQSSKEGKTSDISKKAHSSGLSWMCNRSDLAPTQNSTHPS